MFNTLMLMLRTDYKGFLIEKQTKKHRMENDRSTFKTYRFKYNKSFS